MAMLNADLLKLRVEPGRGLVVSRLCSGSRTRSGGCIGITNATLPLLLIGSWSLACPDFRFAPQNLYLGVGRAWFISIALGVP